MVGAAFLPPIDKRVALVEVGLQSVFGDASQVIDIFASNGPKNLIWYIDAC